VQTVQRVGSALAVTNGELCDKAEQLGRMSAEWWNSLSSEEKETVKKLLWPDWLDLAKELEDYV
jgi:hypothetical protein